MAFSEFEIKRYEKMTQTFLDTRRPPVEVRDQLDLGFTLKNQSIELFEIRPSFANPIEKTHTAIAKATFVKSQKCWKVYWQRADMKWQAYPPAPSVKTLEEFLSLVDHDEHDVFFG